MFEIKSIQQAGLPQIDFSEGHKTQPDEQLDIQQLMKQVESLNRELYEKNQQILNFQAQHVKDKEKSKRRKMEALELSQKVEMLEKQTLSLQQELNEKRSLSSTTMSSSPTATDPALEDTSLQADVVGIKELKILNELNSLSTSISIGDDDAILKQAKTYIGKKVETSGSLLPQLGFPIQLQQEIAAFTFPKEEKKVEKKLELRPKHRQLLEKALEHHEFILLRLEERISWIIDKLGELKEKVGESSLSMASLTGDMTCSISFMTRSLFLNKGDRLTKQDIEELLAYFEMFQDEIQHKKTERALAKKEEKEQERNEAIRHKAVILRIEEEKEKVKLETFKAKLLKDISFCEEHSIEKALKCYSNVDQLKMIHIFDQENNKLGKREFENFSDFKLKHAELVASIANMGNGSPIYNDRLFEYTKLILGHLEKEVGYIHYAKLNL